MRGQFGVRQRTGVIAEGRQQIEPVRSLPSLYATETMWSELKAFAYNDFRGSPLMADVRVLEVGSLLKAMEVIGKDVDR